MTIDFRETGKVRFQILDYLEEILQGLQDDLKGTNVAPAANHLFKVNEDATMLKEDKVIAFPRCVVNLLFMAKRSQPDIQSAIVFLRTGVKGPDTDDWKKLQRVMDYISQKQFLPLVLGWDQSGSIHWYVNAAFALHDDC